MRHAGLVLAAAVCWWGWLDVAESQVSLPEIIAIMNISINNIPANRLNLSSINTTLLSQLLAAQTDPRFLGVTLDGVLQTLFSASVSVQACPVGTYSSSTSLQCVLCPAGTYSTQIRASTSATCQLCPAGTFGTIQGANSSSVCQPCPANTFSNVTGASSPTQCASCPAFSSATTGAAGVAACTCIAGYYKLPNNTCGLCQQGYYCAAGVSNRCPSFGFSTSPVGASLATQCLCLAGYTGQLGVSGGSCGQCPANSYCPGNTANGPTPCPASSTSPIGSISVSQCQCNVGYQQANYANVVPRTLTVPTTACVCNIQYPCTAALFCGCAQNQVCGSPGGVAYLTTLTCPQGYLQLFPGNGAYYPPSQSQYWLISPTNASTITITFTYMCLALNDQVTVYTCRDNTCSGATISGTYTLCSSTLPTPLTVATGFARIVWTSTSSSPKATGWQATYSSTTNCVPLSVTYQDGSTNGITYAPTAVIPAWTGDALVINANTYVQVSASLTGTVIQGPATTLNWAPTGYGSYYLVDSLYPTRYRIIEVLPIAPTTWDIYVDISADQTTYILSGPVVGNNAPVYATVGDIISMNRLQNTNQLLLASFIGSGNVNNYTMLQDNANGVIGQLGTKVTWNTTNWPPGTYYYARASPPGPIGLNGVIQLFPRPPGLQCIYCTANDFCYNGNQFQCPANSQSPAGATDVSACTCNPGFYTATTNLIAYGNSETVDNGGRHACVVTQGNGLWCWGANEKGQLGIGTVTTYSAPTQVNMTGVASVALGDDFTCVLQTNAKVRCWGGNGYGQLGMGTNTPSTGVILPQTLADVNLGTSYTVSQLSCADWSCCAIFAAGTSTTPAAGVRCWGQAAAYQLGYNTYSNNIGLSNTFAAGGVWIGMGDSMTILSFLGGNVASQVAMGGQSSCAVMVSGAVQCWGSNTNGQLGAGPTSLNPSPPVQVLLPSGAKSVSCYSQACCVVYTTLQVACWGYGLDGRLGQGVYSVGSTVDSMGANLGTVDLGSGIYALDVTVGAYQTCALLSNNHVKCWGLVNGQQLGVNPVITMAEYLPNVQFAAGRAAIEINGKNQSLCSVMSDYSVVCWGNNDYKQLGASAPNIHRRLLDTSYYTGGRSLLQYVPAASNILLLPPNVVVTTANANLTNMTLVPLPVTAIPSSGTPVQKVCAICPANAYCTGANGGSFEGFCGTNAVSLPQSSSVSACICVNGYQPTASGGCTPCSGTIYCYASTAMNCPANSASGNFSFTATNCSCNGGYTGQNGSACTPCTAGYYKIGQGNATCSACPVGTMSNVTALGNLTGCLQCPAGTFAQPAATACTQCQAGYASSAGSGSCGGCTAGQYAVQGSNQCQYCPAGTYNPNGYGAGIASCLGCVAGKFSGVVGSNTSTTCQSCPAGKISGANATACVQCGANQFSMPGAQTCLSCPANSTSPPGAAGSQCTCVSGYYPVTSTVAPFFTCQPCGPGTWSTAGNSTCIQCAAGKANPAPVAVSAAACVACSGGFSAPTGSSVCTGCTIGTYSNSGASNCTACAPGNWAAVQSTSCTPCPPGTYSTSVIGSAQACTICPVGFYCTGGTAAVPCPSGTYSSVVGYSMVGQCLACPANYYCPTSYLKAACPTGTSSNAGSISQLSCACSAGYQCSYSKVVEAVVTLNMSAVSFAQAAVQQAFINAVAAAANVASSNVYIQSYSVVGPGSRRLLADTGAKPTPPQVHVFVGVKGTDALLDLDHHLKRHKLLPSLDYAWIAPHVVHVQ